MAVYTDVAAEELAAFIAGYDIGELLAYKGIAEGVENSNFLVHAGRGSFILTLPTGRIKLAPAGNRECVVAPHRKIRAGQMQPRQCFAERGGMRGTRPADP